MQKINLSILISSALFFSACQKDEEMVLDCNAFEWEYEGSGAPVNWTGCFLDCGGQVQSPVNIANSVENGQLSSLIHSYENAAFEFFNNGHTVEFEYEAGSNMIFEGIPYELLQFHFHTGSEHQLNGRQYPMEIHLVHKNVATGNLAVIGVFFEEGNENSFLEKLGTTLPIENERISKSEVLNVKEVLPTDGSYYTYGGSLTTPPCSEIVNWVVMENSVEASPQQIERFHEVLRDNYRPLQAINGRSISHYIQ
ncbi:MAG: carbonic anhydrase [Saprospiraceae bacterium]